MKCNICEASLGDPIFEANSNEALTSLCEIAPGRSRVWACSVCGHVRGEELSNTSEYYAADYHILLNHEDEDQIYQADDKNTVYRTDHQVNVLLEKIVLPNEALLLDYGCAKASTPKRLLERRADLKVHLFDVSEMYITYWNRFVDSSQQAIHKTPNEWQNRFDVITSFFALEHIPSPKQTLRHIAQLLNDRGILYGIVPDTFGNPADFIVVDHVNHFTESSLYVLLRTSGFIEINIDSTAHRGALVFTAKKSGVSTTQPSATEAFAQAKNLAKNWNYLGAHLTSEEQKLGDVATAIYGSGFYGAYIFSTLQYPDRVQCFLDRSPYQQGKNLFGKPILSPEQLPENIKSLYVGLNPHIARETMSAWEWLQQRNLHLTFLDRDKS